MADWVKDRQAPIIGLSSRTAQESRNAIGLERQQDRTKENFERNLPAMIRDGKDIDVSFDADIVTTVEHTLKRRPRGWFLHTIKGDAHAIIETYRDEFKIVLQNKYTGATNVTAKLWIW